MPPAQIDAAMKYAGMPVEAVAEDLERVEANRTTENLIKHGK